MRKVTWLLSVGSMSAVMVLGLAIPQAKAIGPFKDGFNALYVKADSSDAKDKAFAQQVAKARCNVCHVGEDKEQRNTYGKELAKLLDRKKDKADKAKIQAALKKVAAMKSNASDPSSPTFGELIQQGKLPGVGAK
jgi:cytochrome c2